MQAIIFAVLRQFWRPIAAVLGGLAAYFKGRSDQAAKQEKADAKHYKETRENVDEALRRLDGDISAARERLRNRRIAGRE